MTDEAIIRGQRADDGGRPEDTELLRRYAGNRSEEAFAEFVRRHINLVYGAALRRTGGNAHHASDVVQRVFIAAARNARSLARHTSVTGWLYTATRNAAFNLMRDEQRRQRREAEAHAVHELFDASPEANWTRLRPVLDAAMDELADRDREAVLLRFFEGRALADIGTRLDVTENAARMRVERALEKLRVLLTRRGVSSTNAALGLMLANEGGLAAPMGLAATVTGSALAAGSVVGPLVGILGFMTTTKFVASVAAVALALVVGFAIHEVEAEREAEASLRAMAREADELGVALRDRQQHAQTAEQDRSALELALGEARAADAEAKQRAAREAATAAAVPTPPAAEMLALGNEFLRAHPEMRRLLVEYTRLRTLYEFAPLIEPLGLTGEQVDALVNAKEAGGGLYFGMAANSLAVTLSLSERQPREQREVVENQVSEILGGEGYRRYQDALRSRPADGLVAELAGSLYWTDTPLTAAQLRGVRGIVLESSPEYLGGRPLNPNNLDWEAVLARSQTILSGPQLTELAGLRAQQRYWEATGRAQAEFRKRQAATAGSGSDQKGSP